MSLVVRAPENIRIAVSECDEWYDGQWAIGRGCTKISPGCVNCTAAASLIDTPVAEATADGGARWTGIVEPIERQIEVTPTRWPRPLKLFVGSMTDFWHEQYPDEFRRRVWDVVHRYTQHTFAFLTKRSKEMLTWFERIDFDLPNNAWIGVTVETDDYRWRIDHLLSIPAKVRYVQCEPLLDRVHLRRYLEGSNAVDWVIAGPEWGCTHPRPCDVRWMRQIRDDCTEAGVPFFTKHLLDGCAHRQMP
ncbi:MAG: DUF5131 family protein [Gemmatimonadota bacterium]|nr:MAG: DUF5131 family protein [Gemmatimonadota bacterium]